jgi:molybdate transport system substrate-binding protein
MKSILNIILVLLSAFGHLHMEAQPLRLAVAANAQFVISALQLDFRKKSGIASEAIIGSSGNLATQIKNGAPYDVFLSADMAFPLTLFKAGVAISEPKAYALGSLIVCSTTLPSVSNWKTLLLSGKIARIAMANPALAPYGRATEEALRAGKIWDAVKARLVQAESISQVNTYVTTGVVPIGFTTESLVYEYKGKNRLAWERIDPGAHGAITQGVVILQYARKGNYDKAVQFLNYLSTEAARKILEEYGYRAPAR